MTPVKRGRGRPPKKLAAPASLNTSSSSSFSSSSSSSSSDHNAEKLLLSLSSASAAPERPPKRKAELIKQQEAAVKKLKPNTTTKKKPSAVDKKSLTTNPERVIDSSLMDVMKSDHLDLEVKNYVLQELYKKNEQDMKAAMHMAAKLQSPPIPEHKSLLEELGKNSIMAHMWSSSPSGKPVRHSFN